MSIINKRVTSANSHKPELPMTWHTIRNGAKYLRSLRQYFIPWLEKIDQAPLINIGGLSGEISQDCGQIAKITVITNPKKKLPSDLVNHDLIIANYYQLPFKDKSINGCLLANSFNYCKHPLKLLHEVDRIIDDDGYLYISIFNPLSTISVMRYLPQKHKKNPSIRRLYTYPYPLLKWLNLLSYRIVDKQILSNQSYSSPLNYFGPLIVIVAQKQTIPLKLQPVTNLASAYKKNLNLADNLHRQE